MESVNIRDFEDKDWPELRALIMEQWNDRYAYNAVEYNLLDPYMYEDEYLLDIENYKFFIAEDDKGLCGFIFVSYGKDSLNLEYVYVAQRKRRQGVSMELMKYIEKYGRHLGKKEIVMWSLVQNDRSHTMKEKLGYKFEMYSYTARKNIEQGKGKESV